MAAAAAAMATAADAFVVMKCPREWNWWLEKEGKNFLTSFSNSQAEPRKGAQPVIFWNHRDLRELIAYYAGALFGETSQRALMRDETRPSEAEPRVLSKTQSLMVSCDLVWSRKVLYILVQVQIWTLLDLLKYSFWAFLRPILRPGLVLTGLDKCWRVQSNGRDLLWKMGLGAAASLQPSIDFLELC